MGIKFRNLFGCTASIGFIILAVAGLRTFAVSIGVPQPTPPTGFLRVTIDAPNNINSAVQWNVSQGLHFSDWFNNGDTVADPSGGYSIKFRAIPGWVMPGIQGVTLPAGATNTFFGSYSFDSLIGDYQGLFSETSGPRNESCGFCEISGGKGLSFSGKILCAGSKYSFSGKFDNTGNAWTTIPRRGASALSIHLAAGEDTLTGEISNETWTATILAKRNTFDSKSSPAPQAGKYTFAFVDTNSTTLSVGDSFGTMTIDRGGGVTTEVTMADETKAPQKTFLAKDGTWPFYVSLYSGKGFAFGWLQLQGQHEFVPKVVELYRDCNYSGGSLVFSPYYDYDYVTLWYMGLYTRDGTNDFGAGRSVKVPLGCTVTFYPNGDFTGTPFVKTSDDSCFADEGIQNVNSIRVTTNVVIVPDFGSITWMKPSDARTKYYPAGFTNQLHAFVSAYQTAPHAPVMDYTAGNAMFQEGISAQTITNTFTIDSNGKFSGGNKLNLTIATSSGSFKGSMINPLTGKPISFSGVFLQTQHFGRGFFLDGNQSGEVYFGH